MNVACWLLACSLAAEPASGTAAGPPPSAVENLRLTLPPDAYAVVGRPFDLYFDNLVLTQHSDRYRFEVVVERDGTKPAAGRGEPRRWTFTPEASHVGPWRLQVRVFDGSAAPPATATCTLHVVAADAGGGRESTLLIVGDSLTHATQYPNELARLLSSPGNPRWAMLGTHRPANAAPGVAHEGYGGWTWEAFAARHYPVQKPELRQHDSPFVFVDAGKPTLDVGRYFDGRCAGRRPDVVFFLLGINDCFSAPPDDPKKLDERIDGVFAQAETLLAAMRRAAPQAALAVCLTTPPNVREEAFQANYKGKYPRWGWKRIQHRLVERQIAQFRGREGERIFVVPTELNVDPIDGYPANNGVHPNGVGYGQIAATLYAWLKFHLAE